MGAFGEARRDGDAMRACFGFDRAGDLGARPGRVRQQLDRRIDDRRPRAFKERRYRDAVGDLAISEKEISVRYRFFNRAATEKTVTVAFPMPDVTFPDIDTSFAFPEPESNNFLQFHTSVDGRDVHTYYEEKAISNGVDISARLKALGLPLAPQREATDKALDALPRATQDELVKLGFAIPTSTTSARGWNITWFRAGRSNLRSIGTKRFPPAGRS